MIEWNELGKPTLMAKWLQMHDFFLLQEAPLYLVCRLLSELITLQSHSSTLQFAVSTPCKVSFQLSLQYCALEIHEENPASAA